jgi:hypothetical protein
VKIEIEERMALISLDSRRTLGDRLLESRDRSAVMRFMTGRQSCERNGAGY